MHKSENEAYFTRPGIGFRKPAAVHGPGKEVVVIGNTATAPVDLTGWEIVDQNNKAERITNPVLPPGESLLVLLSGKYARPGNKGGTIRLCITGGSQVHAVSYSN